MSLESKKCYRCSGSGCGYCNHKGVIFVETDEPEIEAVKEEPEEPPYDGSRGYPSESESFGGAGGT